MTKVTQRHLSRLATAFGTLFLSASIAPAAASGATISISPHEGAVGTPINFNGLAPECPDQAGPDAEVFMLVGNFAGNSNVNPRVTVETDNVTGAFAGTFPAPNPAASADPASWNLGGRQFEVSVRCIGPSGEHSDGDIVGASAPKFTYLPGPPDFRKRAEVSVAKGTVMYRTPHTRSFVSLFGVLSIPLGSTIDTTHGTLKVVLAKKGGGTITARFYSGKFVIRQIRDGHGVAKLAGGGLSSCSARAAQRTASIARRHRTRRLWGKASGGFRTVGRYASATERGTKWLTEDTCSGTRIRVTRGAVAVRDFRRHRTVIVHGGHSYLARRR